MIDLVDTHAHLDQDDFDVDRSAVIARASEMGVNRMIAIGTTAATSGKCARIANEYRQVWAAVGIQPNYVHEAQPTDWDEIVLLADSPRVVALGETGLDRYWDNAPFPLQQDYFDRHLRLAQQLNLPVVIHMRECGADVVAMVREAAERGPVRGVMHSFTGDVALAEECLALGLYISFAGMVTYKKSEDLRQCAAAIPADRLLIETDSPYLSPQPVRGVRRNEPAHLLHTAECLSGVRGLSLKDFASQTTANARRLFGLD